MLVVEEQPILQLSRFAEAARIQKRLNHFWHAADEVVIAQLLYVTLRKGIGQREISSSQGIQHEIVAGCEEKFVKGQGVDEQVVDFPDREGDAPVKGDAQKRPGSDEGGFRAALGERFEGGKGPRAFLNLVEHYESVRVFGVNAGVQGDGVEQPRRS